MAEDRTSTPVIALSPSEARFVTKPPLGAKTIKHALQSGELVTRNSEGARPCQGRGRGFESLRPLQVSRREGRDVVTLNMNAASLYMKRRRSLRLSRRRRRMPSANRYVIAAKLRLNSCEISAPIDSSSESAPGTVVHCGEEWRPSPRRLAAISSSIARRSVSSIRWGASK
jgi:hypothetical protein